MQDRWRSGLLVLILVGLGTVDFAVHARLASAKHPVARGAIDGVLRTLPEHRAEVEPRRALAMT
ncbi:Hypothetical protein CAP_5673 [Chondromyces apiculatus DSM 436]|uniref:Uncharacterized protein n=1 Tax=Chondromyces apiculatus DSM 436 TaxID=1192034 RepID=A0A017T435_9BACT|nr:Hypothetical protein CAP_5673 [Chondromyces apiculatus DSM 436]